MWACPKCGENIPDAISICTKCSAVRSDTLSESRVLSQTSGPDKGLHPLRKPVLYAAIIAVSIVLLVVFTLLLPLIKDAIDWNNARHKNLEVSYLEYRKQHPAGLHLDEALSLGAELGWAQSVAKGDIHSYKRHLERYPNSRYSAKARKQFDELSWKHASKTETILGYKAYIGDNGNGSYIRQANEAITRLAANKHIYVAALAVGSKDALSEFLSNYPGHINEKDAMVELDELNSFGDGDSKTGTFIAVEMNVNIASDGSIKPRVLYNDVATVYIRLADGTAVEALCRGKILRTLNEGAIVEIRPRVYRGWGVFRVVNNRRTRQHSRSGVFRKIRVSDGMMRLEEAPRDVFFRLGEGGAISLENVDLRDSFE